MKTPKPILCILGAVALAASSSTALADSFPEKTGYLIDSRGNIVRNSYGECWRTGYWTPDMAIAECDPGLTKVKPEEAEAKPAVPGETKPSAAPEKPIAPAAQAYFNAEALFDFDKAMLKSEGQKILDEKIVANMQMHPEVTLLIITGHADRIGTEEYNQGLSERRANAAKAYLVSRGVAAERIRASGKGESEPNPAANTRQACQGMAGNKLIACLQPDRRVTVEPQRQAAAR